MKRPSMVRLMPYGVERLWLRAHLGRERAGDALLPPETNDLFLKAPYDICPDFVGPGKLWKGRGGDHPRYGRFLYALARAFQPERIVEVGSFAGGTAVGWSRALRENGRGRLICVDNDSYSRGVYPEMTRANVGRTGLEAGRVEFRSGDSKELLPDLAREHPQGVDLYLVDADHTYEGAMADLSVAPDLVRPGGLVLVHDIDPAQPMAEATPAHPYPVLEAFQEVAQAWGWESTTLTFIRKHLGVLVVPRPDTRGGLGGNF